MKRNVCAAMAFALFLITAGAGAGQQLVIWSQPYSQQAEEEIDSIIADYNKANPGVTVIYERRSNNDHKVALRVAASGKKGPDIYQMWGGLGLGGEFVNAGFSAPLNKYYDEYGWDDELLTASLSDSRRYRGDERHGVPFRVNAQGLYYNKRLFEKAGVTKIPETYDELVEVCEKLKAAKIPAITFGGSVNWFLMRLVDVLLEKNCGAADHDKLIAMELDWSTHPGVLKTFEELELWSDNYILKPFMGMGADQSRTLFYNGRAAMQLESDAQIPRIQANADINDFDFFLFPTGTNRLYFYAELWYVNENSRMKDQAAKFIDYFVSRDIQQRLIGKLGIVSVNTSVTYGGAGDLPISAKWREAYAAHNQTFPNGDQGFPLDVCMEYFRVINAVASDKMAPAEAGRQMQIFIENNKRK
ncbi:MAG: extracellular solute-binding protein [Planctomycetota bacterium]|jgi:raffinose/stachyose/melibiose transport system substrate-binding protein|nr:extracellular solute-binding protein [Planctomycetota bacterium]